MSQCVSKNPDTCNKDNKDDEDGVCEISESTGSINLPRYTTPNKNDLTALEISIASSSRYTLSGDDMSFESHSMGSNSRINTLENELILQGIDRSSYIETMFNSSAKDELGR
jgi:hypothetical protein